MTAWGAQPVLAGGGGRLHAPQRTFGISSLGTRRQRFWFGLIGAIALLVPYAGVIASAIKAEIDVPAAVLSIPAVSMPSATFPELAVPKLRDYPAPPAAIHQAASAPSTTAAGDADRDADGDHHDDTSRRHHPDRDSRRRPTSR